MPKDKQPVIQSTGFGESPIHAAPEGSFGPSEIDWASCTVNGQPVPEHLWGLLPYTMTDQGRVERNAGKEPACAEIVSEPGDPTREAQHFADSINAGLPFEEIYDPLRLAMQASTPKGHRGLMMSRMKCNTDGMRRGVLDYKPVMVERDGKLERVEVGNMFLASVPEHIARAADKYYADKAKAMLTQSTDRVREQSEQVIAEKKLQKIIDRRRGGGLDFDGLQAEDGEMVTGELSHEFAG